MRIIITSDYNEMSKKAAEIIAAVIKENGGRAVLGLATGSTPIGTYNELIRKYNDGELDFSGIRTVNLDEYKGLSRDNIHSYFYFMNDRLFGRVNINPGNTYIPDGLAKNDDAECTRYDKIIKDLGGVDIQLLGIGHNGHIGFNEPSVEFSGGTHVVTLAQSTINANSRLFDKKEDVPKKAFTMGCEAIMNSKQILLLASGKDKAEIIKALVNGPVTPQVPASVLKLHPNADIVIDSEAGSLL